MGFVNQVSFYSTLKYLLYSWAAISVLIQSGILKSQGANVKQDEQSKKKYVSSILIHQ